MDEPVREMTRDEILAMANEQRERAERAEARRIVVSFPEGYMVSVTLSPYTEVLTTDDGTTLPDPVAEVPDAGFWARTSREREGLT